MAPFAPLLPPLSLVASFYVLYDYEGQVGWQAVGLRFVTLCRLPRRIRSDDLNQFPGRNSNLFGL